MFKKQLRFLPSYKDHVAVDVKGCAGVASDLFASVESVCMTGSPQSFGWHPLTDS